MGAGRRRGYTSMTPASGLGARHERRSRAAGRAPGPPGRAARPSTRSPPRSSAAAMETVCFEMATYVSRTATTPILNQSQRAQRHHPRRPGPPRRAVGRHPAVHAHVDAAGALRARVPRRRRVPRGRRVRRQRPVPRRRPPPRLQRLRARLRRRPGHRRAPHGAHRVDPVPPRRHRRRRARRLQRHRHRHLGRGRALAGRQGHRPRRRAPRRPLRAAGQQPPPRLHRRPARADRRRPARRPTASATSSTATASHTVEAVGRLHDRLRGPPLPRGGRARGPTASTRPTPTSTTTRSATPTSTCT